MKNLFQKIKAWYGELPDKKKHIELIAAALSVPMMLTIIVVNINNINSTKSKALGTETTPAPIQVIIDNPQNSTTSPTQADATPTTTKNTGTITPTVMPTVVACKKEIGPVSISSPLEGEIITDDKVNIMVSTDSNYCPVTWSYKLGSGSWSDFSSNNISLYNLTAGKKQIQVKIKNAAGDKTVTLERNFIYQSSANLTPTASPSATVNQ